ncbi:Sir2 family NAD-dependent protein deacetylase [Pseudactinotalea suaedae]|uniref:Sir2 family NAD-dependent protein deacetylase n=1 Tax=Pseudactinotalea suaedae TaxID=1524924 RepID=UPI0012E2350B|nr:Sir2 family NAD-dependent protein deacetylase [Pseudactinotalea suaedae]
MSRVDKRPGPVEQAARILAGSRFTVLTGAGISTDSGIPDYRGPDSPPRTPMTYQQFVGDEVFRRHYWARNHVGWRHMRTTLPNAGHRALVGLERRGLLTGVITQNVDLLHEQAGARNVIDLHGHYNEVICLSCRTVFTRAHVHERLEEANPDFAVEVGDVEIAPDADAVLADTAGFVVPPCEVCGGMLKPNIVYFGENVPKERVADAFAMLDDGGALLVAGSSLTVMSGLRFVRRAHAAGKPVVIVNRGTTRGDELADLVVDDGTSEFLAELAASLPDL